MKVRPLIIGDVERATLEDLCARAAASPTPYATMKAMADAHTRGTLPPASDLNAATTVEIPVGYTVTLTHEEHKPGVMCRHISVGIRNGEREQGPSPEAVAELMRRAGFVNGIGKLPMWIETLDDGTLAINAVEPLSGDVEALRK